jgi:hypothetical protein
MIRLFRGLGVDIRRVRPGQTLVEQVAGHHLVPNYHGRSAREQVDIRTIQPFGRLAEKVVADRRTYLYYDRLYTIFQGIANLARLAAPDAHVAEIGVFRGGGTYFMASALAELGLGSRALHAFDTFSGHDGVDIQEEVDDAVTHTEHKFSGTSLESVREYTAGFPNVHLHVGRIQASADGVAGLKFGFVHLDVDLYDPTVFGLEFFAPRLVPGGMLVVDDYDCVTCPGVRKAIDTFLSGRQGQGYVRLDLLSAQCVLIRT